MPWKMTALRRRSLCATDGYEEKLFRHYDKLPYWG